MTHKRLFDQLVEYGASGAYPFHMPGHKRQGQFPNPYTVDITEIEGFDNLHHPEGILKDSMARAAAIYGVKKTYYLVNGSSSGILSAVSAATTSGGTILISRNCHKAVYHGVFLRKLKTVYCYPQILADYGIIGGLLAADIESLLISNQDVQAVLIVSPTYDGVISDIRAIAEAVHRFGILLIVDEAHGAHLPFGKGPQSAVSLGADIVIQSVHKTLPALTQTAVLHVCSEFVDQQRLERYLQIYQSSSPSYVLMSSIECAIDFMQHEGKVRLDRLDIWIDEMTETLRELKVLKLVGSEMIGTAGVYDFDRTKLLFYVPGCVRCLPGGIKQRLNGGLLAEILRNEYQIEMELSAMNYVMGLATCMDSQNGFRRLTKALLEIDGQLQLLNPLYPLYPFNLTGSYVDVQPQVAMTLVFAWECRAERVKWTDCEQRISAEFIDVYPPGIPIVVPGEVITASLKKQIEQYRRSGLTIYGGGEYLDCVSG